MKILILSDTHGYCESMWDIISREEPIDMVIHCGDLEVDPTYIRSKVDCTLHMVAGNNDYGNDLPQSKIIDIGRFKGLLLHGHRQHIYSGYESLYYLALENKVDFVFFGHTHIPAVIEKDGITLVNPGSLTYPRQSGRIPTYVVLTLEGGNKPQFELKYYKR